MRTLILFQYLVGNRQAILTLASSPWTLVLGAMLVLSAGLARDYDGEDLLHEPWHLLVPFVASLLASLFLFAVAWSGCRQPSGAGPGLGRRYLAFLGLFWMTAPLAWLYAVPYERFLSPLGAVQANLLTLGCVALWRVALMVRVLVVLFGYRIRDAIFIVMGVADAMAFAAIVASPFGLVIAMMGGVRGSETDRQINGVAAGLSQLGFCTGVVWLIGLLNAVSTPRKGPPSTWPQGKARPNWSFWGVAIGALLVWIPLSLGPQAEQRLRHEVERDFQQGDLDAALTTMSAHSQDDFPPHWQPPPRITNDYQRDKEEQLIAIWEILLTRPTLPWVRDAYLMKLREMLSHSRLNFFPEYSFYERLIKVLAQLPEAPELLAEANEGASEEFWGAFVESPLKSDLSVYKPLAEKLAKREEIAIRLFVARVLVATGEVSAGCKIVVDCLEGGNVGLYDRALPDVVQTLLKEGSPESRQTALLVFTDKCFAGIWRGQVRASLTNRCAVAGIGDGYLSYLRLLDIKGNQLGIVGHGTPVSEVIASEIVGFLAPEDPEIIRIKTMYPSAADQVAPLKDWLKAKAKALQSEKVAH